MVIIILLWLIWLFLLVVVVVLLLYYFLRSSHTQCGNSPGSPINLILFSLYTQLSRCLRIEPRSYSSYMPFIYICTNWFIYWHLSGILFCIKNIIIKFWSFLQLTWKFYLYFTLFSDHILSSLTHYCHLFTTKSLEFSEERCYLDIS